jgi:S1-C subfamily serine protease
MFSMVRSIAAMLVSLVFAQTALAQPALDRVEKQLRSQLKSQAKPGDVAEDRQSGYLGLVADEDEGRGLVVLETAAGGPAAAAGIRVDDRIVAIDQQPVLRLDEMSGLLKDRRSGEVVTLAIERGGKSRDVKITLGRRQTVDAHRITPLDQSPAPAEPAPAHDPDRPRMGVRTLPISDEAMKKYHLPDRTGALVSTIVPGLPFEQSGIPVGAAITAVDDQAVENPQQLADFIHHCKAGQTIELTYNLAGEVLRKSITLTGGQTSGDERIKQLERRIEELESQVKKLEVERDKAGR